MPYTIRESTRARHIRLTMSARDGLVVVIPRGARNIDVPKIINERAAWVQSSFSKIADRYEKHHAPMAEKLPLSLDFRAFGDIHPVSYMREAGKDGVRIGLHSSVVVLKGNVDDHDLCVAALLRFVSSTARNAMPDLVYELADAHGLNHPAKIRIGAPRSRWGSYSSTGTLSLSRNLLFLPPHLMEHVILHELVHQVHGNHSAEFYRYLASVDPHAGDNRTQLKRAASYVPVWANE